LKRRLITALSLCVALASSGLSAKAQTSSGLQISPPSLDFGEDSVHSDSPPQTVTLRNPTQSPLLVEQILASGIDFSEKNDCPRSLAPQAQCSIQVSFTPVISGPRTGNLAIAESNGNAHFVALNGTGK